MHSRDTTPEADAGAAGVGPAQPARSSCGIAGYLPATHRIAARWGSSSPSTRPRASWLARSRRSSPTRCRPSSTTWPRCSRSGPQLTLADRARYLRKAADVLVEEVDEVAELLTREQGKPITESYTMEVVPTIDVLHWCAEAGPKILADEQIRMRQAVFLSKKAKFSYEPLGVVGVIAPWNYPWSIPFDEVAMALMAGNGVVLKPASLTPLLGERIRETFEKAGLPEGLVRVVHGGGRGRRGAVRVVGAEDLLHRLGRGGSQGRRDLRQAG